MLGEVRGAQRRSLWLIAVPRDLAQQLSQNRVGEVGELPHLKHERTRAADDIVSVIIAQSRLLAENRQAVYSQANGYGLVPRICDRAAVVVAAVSRYVDDAPLVREAALLKERYAIIDGTADGCPAEDGTGYPAE